jgi:hypothetical protein
MWEWPTEINVRKNSNLTRTRLNGNAIAVSECVSTALWIREMSGQAVSVVESTYYISKGSLCPRNNDVHHISEDILNILAKH